MKPADIILVRGSGWVPKWIMEFTSKPGEPALVSHAGVFVCESHVIEAKHRVLTTRWLKDFPGEWVVYSPKNITDEDRRCIAQAALGYSARSYGYLKIGAQFLDWATGSRFFTSKVLTSDRFPYCSFLVAQSYATLGLDFGVPSTSTTPDDILDFVVRNPDKYELVAATTDLLLLISEKYGVPLPEGEE